MTPQDWQLVKEIFEAAVERPQNERAAFLSEVCTNAEMKLEIESLIAAHESDSRFMNTPAAQLIVPQKALLAPGQSFGPYSEIFPLDQGGMGEVYSAVDTRLGRKVALKVLPAKLTGEKDGVRRFGQEARAASALNHPNIVTIHEIGQSDSLHFIATEFIEGKTLREQISNNRMTLGEVLDVAVQVAVALEAAHESGIVHRDIKPENIMLRHDRVVKVLDFGLAKLIPENLSDFQRAGGRSLVKTHPGVVMGTVGYMSPQQARGQDVDARTDIWSLGVVLYEMVSGRRPFEGETPSHVIVSILEKEPPGLSEVPAELSRIIRKALRKEPDERYQTARAMASDLKDLSEDLTVESRLRRYKVEPANTNGQSEATAPGGVQLLRTSSSAEYLFNGIKRHKTAVLMGITAFLILIASLVYFTRLETGSAEAIDSVAVLPFVNVAGDPNVEYLSDGISDSIISSLSRLPELRVTSLGSVLRYKGRDMNPQAIGRELNVGAVLIGRMTQRGDALTVNTELVHVRDNRRLWAGNYNVNASDVLTVQEQIANEVIGKLRVRGNGSDEGTLTKSQTSSNEAYRAYATGRFLLEKRAGASTEKSVEYFEQAIKIDPNYAVAHAILAYAYWSLGNFNRQPMDEILPKAKQAAARALELDETLGEAHVALGHIASTQRDWPSAERSFRRAVELSPNSAFAHSNYAFYFISARRFDEAVAESKRAVELEPTSVLYNRNFGLNLYFARRYEEAIQQCKRTVELDPNMNTAYSWMSFSYEQKRDYDNAITVFLDHLAEEFGPEEKARLGQSYASSGWRGFWQRMLSVTEEKAKITRTDRFLTLATIHVRLGDKEKAIEYLQKASSTRSWGITTLNADPVWDGIRSDQRYKDLVLSMGLTP